MLQTAFERLAAGEAINQPRRRLNSIKLRQLKRAPPTTNMRFPTSAAPTNPPHRSTEADERGKT
ncbi:MAG: hypothetical protein ACLP59_03020 [Bryobacteraceae bacterium]